LLMLLCLHASADDLFPVDATVELDGLCYRLPSNLWEESATVVNGGVKYQGNVSIPETVNYGGITFYVTSIGEGAFEDCRDLAAVTLPPSLESIGPNAFRGCAGLTEVVIPGSGVMKTIGAGAFADCTSLKRIVFPRPYGQQIVIGPEAFARCTALEKVVIPWSVYSVEKGAFRDCRALKTVVLGGQYEKEFYRSDAISIGAEAFLDCTELRDVYLLDIEEWEAKLLTINPDAFKGCFVEYATLHCIWPYPWRSLGFGTTTDLGDAAFIRKCEKPVISYRDGRLDISCATEDAIVTYKIETRFLSDSYANGDSYWQRYWPQKIQRAYTVKACAAGGSADLPSEQVNATVSWKDDGTVEVDGNAKITDVYM